MLSPIRPTDDPENWRQLKSPALARLVAVELLAQAEELDISKEMRNVLDAVSGKVSAGTNRYHPLMDRLDVWVNVRAFEVFAKHVEEKGWRETALKYCIARQAHFPMLARLFRATKSEVSALRKEMEIKPPPTRNKPVCEQDMLLIWRAWCRVKQTYEREGDRWVTLAAEFSHLPMSVLYQTIIIDGQEAANDD